MRLKHVYRLRTRGKERLKVLDGLSEGQVSEQELWWTLRRGGESLGLRLTWECLAAASGPGGLD